VDLAGDRFGYDRFHDTPQSGNDNAVNLRGGVALTERIALEGGYAFESFVAPNDFYDRQLHRADARMVFDVTSSLQLALGYSYQEGDVISYAVPPRPDIARFSVEREDEDEFGQPLRTAYKLLGRTHALSFSAAYQLTKRASVSSAMNTPSPRTIRWNTRITSSKSKSPLPIEMTSFRGLLYLAVLFPFASDLVAGSLEVMVKDEKGGPVSDAVVYASGGAAGSPSKEAHRHRSTRQAIRSLRDGAAGRHPCSVSQQR
jgi:hypothetical protein